MLASQLITELQNLMAVHGDLPVGGDYGQVVDSVDFNDDWCRFLIALVDDSL